MSEEKLEKLSREHKEIKKTLAEVRKTTAFYQTHFGMANQILTAVKKGHAKTPSYKPEFLADEEYIKTIRNLCVQAIFSNWNQKKTATTLFQIYSFVAERIREMISNHKWNCLQHSRSYFI